MAKDTIRVIVCGDEGVGKTSLVTTFMRGEFLEKLPQIVPPIEIPRDYSSLSHSPQKTVIIDTSPTDEEHLNKNLKNADVIWLVYSDHDSYERISLHWMMLFRSLGLNIPVIVCKNKCDELVMQAMHASQESTKIEDEEFMPILMEFKEIDTCIKSTAKWQISVTEAVYLCQRSIIFPIAPLFDARTGKLKPLAILALHRIFLLSDADQDNLLSDEEFFALQRKCFNKSIDVNELRYIQSTLLKLSQMEPHNDQYYIKDRGITVSGFTTLNKLYADKGRHETIWGILRYFHYTDSLCISDAILHPKIVVPPSASVELSSSGYRFLVNLFIRFDRNNDGALDDQELYTLFKTTPGLPKLWKEANFPFTSVVNSKGYITLQGWLAQWSMTTYINYEITTAYIKYFGFEGEAKSALQVTKPRKYRRRLGRLYRAKVYDRKVFNCFVIGRSNSGKTSVLESFLGRPFSETYSPTITSRLAVNDIEINGDKQYYLILQEFGEQEKAILENQNKLHECDVLCLTYDSSDPESFSYLVELYQQYPHLMEYPTVVVALKADLDKQQQRCLVSPDEFTEQMNINHPLHMSSTWPSSLNELIKKIVEVGLEPGNQTPGLRHPGSDSRVSEFGQPTLMIGVTISIITLITYSCWKLVKTKYK